ncbi:Defensin Tk-AMP-D3 [Euphorbia peplus]|nr:Defensin Tk-AMP-D3 [Euphorbia peplus]
MGACCINVCAAAVIVLILILQPSGTQGAEISDLKLCWTLSSKYKGFCFSTRCTEVCRTESFLDGRCQGLGHRCYCTKPCSEI